MSEIGMNKGNFKYILDSIPGEIVFCDENHKILFLNATALEKYKKSGVVVGDSLLECHKKEESHNLIKAGLEELKSGKNNFLLYKSEKSGKNGYLIAVRDESKNFLGYYEWFMD